MEINFTTQKGEEITIFINLYEDSLSSTINEIYEKYDNVHFNYMA